MDNYFININLNSHIFCALNFQYLIQYIWKKEKLICNKDEKRVSCTLPISTIRVKVKDSVLIPTCTLCGYKRGKVLSIQNMAAKVTTYVCEL